MHILYACISGLLIISNTMCIIPFVKSLLESLGIPLLNYPPSASQHLIKRKHSIRVAGVYLGNKKKNGALFSGSVLCIMYMEFMGNWDHLNCG